MSDLRKAAEMALNVLLDPKSRADECADAVQELRQALAQPEQECTCSVKDMFFGKCCKAQPKQEAFTLDRGCWERGCVAYDERDGDGVTISAERVDETAKRKDDPVAWFIQYEDSHEFVWSKPVGWRVKQALEIQPLYTAPPKREWVGLTDNEMSELANKYKHIETGWYHDTDLIAETEAKLKEKNT